MKTPPSFLLLVGAVLMFAGPLRADDAATTGDQKTQRMERIQEALAKLNLTDAQKEQIKQIRANTTDRKERRQQIVAVLTPEQKATLKELIQQRRAEQ